MSKPKRVIKHELFIGTFSTGLGYADKGVEQHGDYKKIAFLPFGTLKLEVYDPKSPLLSEIQKDADAVIARRGQEYAHTTGQTITLGYAIK